MKGKCKPTKSQTILHVDAVITNTVATSRSSPTIGRKLKKINQQLTMGRLARGRQKKRGSALWRHEAMQTWRPVANYASCTTNCWKKIKHIFPKAYTRQSQHWFKPGLVSVVAVWTSKWNRDMQRRENVFGSPSRPVPSACEQSSFDWPCYSTLPAIWRWIGRSSRSCLSSCVSRQTLWGWGWLAVSPYAEAGMSRSRTWRER